MATSAGPSDALLEPTPASQLPRDRGGRPTPLTAGAHSPTPAHAQSESSPSSPPAGTPRSGCGSDAPGGGQARVLTPLSSSHGNFRDGAPASPSGDGHALDGRASKRRAAAAGGGGPLPKRQALSKGESKGRTAKRTAAEKRMAHDFIKCFLISGWTLSREAPISASPIRCRPGTGRACTRSSTSPVGAPSCSLSSVLAATHRGLRPPFGGRAALC